MDLLYLSFLESANSACALLQDSVEVYHPLGFYQLKEIREAILFMVGHYGVECEPPTVNSVEL